MHNGFMNPSHVGCLRFTSYTGNLCTLSAQIPFTHAQPARGRSVENLRIGRRLVTNQAATKTSYKRSALTVKLM